MKTQNTIQLKFTMLLFLLCFWWSEASAFDWSSDPVVKIDLAGNGKNHLESAYGL